MDINKASQMTTSELTDFAVSAYYFLETFPNDTETRADYDIVLAELDIRGEL